ncbi:coiled-coil domain-containing protein 80 [Lates japonicus]|uniref:Coiled-coil domain-containing protein 80 n=1 Tax=Lates japonicus TaxID=270547 RepID=A0AAD3NEN1_LATJO|nr:coiled-coil domain-containing protein 80 [Lates japonicus]
MRAFILSLALIYLLTWTGEADTHELIKRVATADARNWNVSRWAHQAGALHRTCAPWVLVRQSPGCTAPGRRKMYGLMRYYNFRQDRDYAGQETRGQGLVPRRVAGQIGCPLSKHAADRGTQGREPGSPSGCPAAQGSPNLLASFAGKKSRFGDLCASPVQTATTD